MPSQVYRRETHRFFDDLVTFLVSLAGVLIATEAFRSSGFTKAASDPKYYLQFTGATFGQALTWHPYEALQLVTEDGWPDTIELLEDLSHPKAPIYRLENQGFNGIHATALQSAFIHYYETFITQIVNQNGDHPLGWPHPWNFARVVRNAFAHGGNIDIRNQRSPAVTWKSFTYDHTDNGSRIIFQDLAAVEVISLMREMDCVI